MEPVSSSEIFLGTSCFITIQDMKKPSEAHKALDRSFAGIDDMEQRLSVNIPESEISRINRDGRGVLSPDSLFVLEQSLIIARESDGLFDPTIGSLVSLWDIGGSEQRIPDPSEIETVLEYVDFKSLSIDGNNVSLDHNQMKLDLGGIAKGHAADLVKEELLSSGVSSAIINLGGNVHLIGSKPDGSLWRIGIQNPRDSRGEYIGILSTADKAVVTSGIYERFFEENGVHYHHILDTRTGYPVNNGLLSLTVIADDSITADGLSTALFAMGREAALQYASDHAGVDVIAIDEDDKVYLSEGIRKNFRMTGSEFHLVQ